MTFKVANCLFQSTYKRENRIRRGRENIIIFYKKLNCLVFQMSLLTDCKLG
jgi:hypothetical protein